jgi:uncharacterized membrane protein
MVATKIFAWAEVVMGILLILIPLVWCFTPAGINPDTNVGYLVWIEVALGIIVLIVAALALITKPPPVK